MRRTAITGIGLVSCIGSDLDVVSAALRDGRCGLAVDPQRRELGFYSALTGHIPDWDGGRKRLNRKLRKSMHDPALFAAVAALDAVADSGLDPDRLRQWDVGVVVGNDSTAAPSAAAARQTLEAGETRGLGSGAIFQVMNSTVTMNLSTMLGTRGANWTMSAACASGAHAIGQAAMLIESGAQEIVIAGGAQEIGWQAMAPFDALGAFTRATDPARASRPFDAGRDGLVPSGGAAILIMEDLDAATRRGAHVYAEVLSYAFSSNGAHLSAPTVEGPAYCITRALKQAGLRASDIDYINAHATSTPVGDLLEGRALLQVFGADGPPVSSTKGITGHECWMSGASEIVYSTLMMRDRFLAANHNLDTLEPELAGLNVLGQTADTAVSTVLSNSFGFGGTNCALIIRGA